MKKTLRTALASAALLVSTGAAAQQTTTSPTGGALPAGVTNVGGIVLDLQGTTGARVVTQLSASSLYAGFADANPLTIGTQTGFDATVLAALGGLTAVSVRVTLEDGDSAPGDFDDGNDNTLLLDGIDFGLWSAPTTYQTNSTGTMVLSTGTGFGDGILSTGFFSSTDAGKLAALFAALGDGSVVFGLQDVDPFDNFFDFTQGVDGGLINVGTGPIITPPSAAVPEPTTWAMMMIGFGAVGGSLRRRRKANVKVSFA